MLVKDIKHEMSDMTMWTMMKKMQKKASFALEIQKYSTFFSSFRSFSIPSSVGKRKKFSYSFYDVKRKRGKGARQNEK